MDRIQENKSLPADGESILEALASDNFLIFPDQSAQSLAAPYQVFGDNVIGNKRNIK
jgi:hypothetical protein